MCQRWQGLHRVHLHTARRLSDAEAAAQKVLPKAPATLTEPFDTWPGHVAIPCGLGSPCFTRSQLEEYAHGKVWRSGCALPHQHRLAQARHLGPVTHSIPQHRLRQYGQNEAHRQYHRSV
jgi:hypothetical protein